MTEINNADTTLLSPERLLELYKHYGTIRKVASHITIERVDGKVFTAGFVQRRLKKAYPDYASKTLGDRGRDAVTDEPTKPIAGGSVYAPDKDRRKLTGRRFVFTAAQNNTYLHEEFFASLLKFCAHNDAQLMVSQFAYNKSGFQNGTKENDELWYDPRLTEYLMNDAVEVTPSLLFCGELDILPTAVNPFSGMESYTQSASGIFPHAKVQMMSLPRMKGDDPRFLYTTGAITQRNYIQRKAGQKAEFHHVFGALYVEIDDDGQWFARQLIADTSGSFYDLNTLYTPENVFEKQEVLAINWGDIHVEKYDKDIYEASWGENSILTELKPLHQFIHDLTDFRARNHHNIDDPYFLAEMFRDSTGSVENDIKQAASFLAYISRKGTMTVIVESNHDQAYKLWLKTADIRKDPENAEFFHKSNARIYQAIREKHGEFNVFEWALTDYAGDRLTNCIFLNEDDSYVIADDNEGKGGIECGMHGHRGPNGARGSSKSFRAIGRKVNVGHSHSAGINDGVYTAGVSAKLDMGYNKGPSSWSHSHIITYQNGKRAIITMRGKKWRV